MVLCRSPRSQKDAVHCTEHQMQLSDELLLLSSPGVRRECSEWYASVCLHRSKWQMLLPCGGRRTLSLASLLHHSFDNKLQPWHGPPHKGHCSTTLRNWASACMNTTVLFPLKLKLPQQSWGRDWWPLLQRKVPLHPMLFLQWEVYPWTWMLRLLLLTFRGFRI